MYQFVDTVRYFKGKYIQLWVLWYMMLFGWTFQRSFLLPSSWLSTRRTGNYKRSRRRIPEDFNLHQQRCGNFQSRTWSTAPFGIHKKKRGSPRSKIPAEKVSLKIWNINYSWNVSSSSTELTWGRMADISVPCRHFMHFVRRTNLTNICNTASVKPTSVHVKRKNCSILNELPYCARNVELPVDKTQ